MAQPLNPKLVRAAGILVVLGLLVEAVSLLWNSPAAPYLFFYVGLVLLAAGVLIFLGSFVGSFFKR